MELFRDGNRDKLNVTEIVVGMLVDAKVVTHVPGYDYKFTIHSMTKDEQVTSTHEVLVPADGQSINDIKQDWFGKIVLTAKDAVGRGVQPRRGKLVWSCDRYVVSECHKWTKRDGT